jgi:transglutaminase-like putative cysteine protease
LSTVYPGPANYLHGIAYSILISLKNSPEALIRPCKYLLPIFLCASIIQAAEPETPGKGGDEVPVPSFDRIDYSNPKAYLFLNDNMGSRDLIMKAAETIEGSTPEKKLLAIHRWIESRFTYKADDFSEWRTFDQMLINGSYGGCANYSVIFGSMARACGIPTVWVKTLDADWIRGFRTQGTEGSWNGHVFLEIFIHDRWMLLDDTQLVLYEDYDPKTRILPGNRYAYDKGGDPYELVLSARWELWKKQVRANFSDFDLTKLPVGNGTDLLHNTMANAGNSTIANAGSLKYPAVFAFYSEKNNEGARHLGKILYPKLTHHYTGRYHTAKDYEEQFTKNIKPGSTIILMLTADEKDSMPEAFRDLLPKAWPEIEVEVGIQGSAKYDRTARNVNIITLVAKDSAELTKLVEKTSW